MHCAKVVGVSRSRNFLDIPAAQCTYVGTFTALIILMRFNMKFEFKTISSCLPHSLALL